MATQRVSKIVNMGLPAKIAFSSAKPRVNDIIIRGAILSIDQGSAAERIGIGFGAGASDMQTLVEIYQMTKQGLRKLGSGVGEATAGMMGKTPGGAVGAVTFLATRNPVGLIASGGMKLYREEDGSSKVDGRAEQTVNEIASRLQMRFQEQGWI